MERATFRAAREAIDSTDFSELEQRLNVKISISGGGSFDPTPNGSGTFKIAVTPIINGKVRNKEEMDFERLAPTYGLKASDLGETFLSNGREFRITGLVTRRHKMPISAEATDNGKGFKFRSDTVCRALGREVPISPRLRW